MIKRTYLVLLLATLLVVGCKDEEPIMEAPDTQMAEVLYEGTFESDDHPTSGRVSVEYDGEKTNVLFSDFKTDSGPDLRVYLSMDKTDMVFIDLGALKGTSGAFFYEIENNIDFDSFNTVLIWCEDFSVLFGHADLSQP